MRVLLTGATGYVGKRILPILVNQGHHVVCCVRDKSRFSAPKSIRRNISVIEVDFLNPKSLGNIPKEIDASFYLIHSMSHSNDYSLLEQKCANNFSIKMSQTKVKHVIYLSGISNNNNLSKHLKSRKSVEYYLKNKAYNLTILRAGIIVGSGSASFEIMRDIVEKLPFMITPKWLMTKCQPIGISDVQKYLTKSLLNPSTFNQTFDIGCEDILTYKEMLLEIAKVRGLKRKIITTPIMTPRLSSYWLFFVTSTSYRLASSLVDSMKIEVVCKDNRLNKILDISPISYRESVERAFAKIKNNDIISSWKDSYSSSGIRIQITDFISVPEYGCFKDQRVMKIKKMSRTKNKIWSIGGENGWYHGNWLWRIRGFTDKLFGGVGLRRGRTHSDKLSPGDSLDFWRVLYSNKEEGRLLLFAEMKLPGDAWLEFKTINNELHQTATFRPKGILGRFYWFSVYPFHGFIFRGLLRKLAM